MTRTSKPQINKQGERVRSGFEAALTDELTKFNIKYDYEAVKIPYQPLQKVKHYVPDLVLANGIIVEIKGRFTSPDRQKHKAIKANYPDLDIRFVFQKQDQKINKGSKTSYDMRCRSNGIKCSEGHIPPAWIAEPVNATNKEYIKQWVKK